MNPNLKGKKTCTKHNKVGEANGLGRELSVHRGSLSGRLKVSEKVTFGLAIGTGERSPMAKAGAGP